MDMSQKNLQKPQDPLRYLEHEGAYLLELVEGITTSVVPSSAIIDGNKILVRNGRIKQTVGGMQMHSQDQRFYYGQYMIKMVCDGAGNVLWRNNKNM